MIVCSRKINFEIILSGIYMETHCNLIKSFVKIHYLLHVGIIYITLIFFNVSSLLISIENIIFHISSYPIILSSGFQAVRLSGNFNDFV